MSILIKGMEMPADGNETIIRIQPDGTVLDQYGHHLAIATVPAADVRPVVRGEWHEYDDDYGKICCSVCEEDAPCDYPWNFCPNCGADMRQTDV